MRGGLISWGCFHHVAVDYMSRWIEVVELSTNEVRVMMKFVKKNIFYRFGTPRAIINDEGKHFVNHSFKNLLEKYGLKH